MGTCIICGTRVDGAVCDTHQEDVCFEFRGSDPDDLTTGRYYEGTVDGFADFGVFVNIGDSVTGLLHRSELDSRIDSLDWDVGDTVYVQVTDVQSNGNVDLGWSIRQSEDGFRGSLVDDPDGATTEEPAQGNEDAPAPSGAGTSPAPTASNGNGGDGETATASASANAVEPDVTTPLERVEIASLSDRVGDRVRIEGIVSDIQQTSGPTVFEVRDETGVVSCAAFEEAGVRAYPAVAIGDEVRLDGEVERRHGTLQVETESLEELDGEEAATVRERLETALTERARPENVPLLGEDESVDAVADEIREAATAIRRAVLDSRPVIVRHAATADGYIAGAAIERAVLPMIREEHAQDDAEYHYFDRRPLDDPVYDMAAATNDVTSMLEDRERHGEKLPLVVLVDAGSTIESEEGYELLSIYDVDRVVVDDDHPDPAIESAVSAMVNPGLADASVDGVTTTALAANVAVHVTDVRETIAHLPAVSYWEDPPETYAALADDAGVDADERRELREAVGIEAYYQSYEDKRELVADLLFADAGGLSAHVSEQFRAKLDDELRTAEANVDLVEANGGTIAVLDTDAFTHRFDFPPEKLLLDALHRQFRNDHDGPFATIGISEDEIGVRSTESIDVREVAADVREEEPTAGVESVGSRDGGIRFLRGERRDVLDATISSVAERLA